jgi:hypothetical protein
LNLEKDGKTLGTICKIGGAFEKMTRKNKGLVRNWEK